MAKIKSTPFVAINFYLQAVRNGGDVAMIKLDKKYIDIRE